MIIRPIISPDIVGQYVMRGNKVIDTWADKILYQGNDALKKYQQIRKAGRLNFMIVENLADNKSPLHLVDTLA